MTVTKANEMKVLASFFLFCASFFILLFWAWPVYQVWRAGQTGRAMLMQAEQEKQILIEQARSELEAAKLRAEAIEIVGEASQKYPEYRLQEFIGAFGDAIKSGAIDQIIYVPTEANIPIVEATRLRKKE